MPSIIEGYQYDIFISYRQKDNKYDGWVTEFVENLKRELEATFKEEVSVYFDINPHDGLLETYNVQASLNEKLKCLVFIPIISQTYCDPKSFAWQNELIVFNKMAKESAFGRDVMLANGNIASRILPVKIHTLDPEDKELIENELGGPLRSIDFIYKESGVNRPLTPSDNPDKNQEKTYYRDQVNKVSNSIKAIIATIKTPASRSQTANHHQIKTTNSPRRTFITITVIVFALLAIIYFLSVNPGKNKNDETNNSIAVLYFDNLSSDPEQEYFSDGITEEVISHLSLIKGLRVTSRTSVIPYKGNKNAINVREIAKQLNVAHLLEGTVRKSGDQLRITAQLINAYTDQHIWTEVYDRDLTDVFKIQSEIAQSIAEKFKIIISPEAKSKLASEPTTNIKAYDLYLKARAIPIIPGFGIGISSGPEKLAVSLLRQSIKMDPDFSLPYALLSRLYWSMSKSDSAVLLAKEAIARNPGSPEGYMALANTQDFENALKTLHKECDLDSTRGLLDMANLFFNRAKFPEAVQCYSQVIKINRNLAEPYIGMAYIYLHMAEQDSIEKYIGLARKVAPYSKEIMNVKLEKGQFSGDPDLAKEEAKKIYLDDTLNYYYVVGIAYLFARNWKEAESYYARSNYRDMDWGLVLTKTGRQDSGILVLKNALTFRGSNGWSGDLSRINALLGNKSKAISEFKKLIESGWFDIPWMRNDPFWDVLRDEPEFRRMTDEMEKRKVEMLEKIKNRETIFL